MPQDYPRAAVPAPACREAAETGRTLDTRSVNMSDFWHKMGCCVVAKPPPSVGVFKRSSFSLKILSVTPPHHVTSNQLTALQSTTYLTTGIT
ncbi:hypothetical protein JOQ06_000164 [Pogonophryne albipinna]|uniref:Uncharacterized protein n=1 Tax=Pogonophryne albipinna TaxID=1090488 RepID=A0AAD6A520_9TELE|nr:hypothetical protein JOQ06_000164 [Pogonophryne albipinna]